jgi:hypothetical protein
MSDVMIYNPHARRYLTGEEWIAFQEQRMKALDASIVIKDKAKRTGNPEGLKKAREARTTKARERQSWHVEAKRLRDEEEAKDPQLKARRERLRQILVEARKKRWAKKEA